MEKRAQNQETPVGAKPKPRLVSKKRKKKGEKCWVCGSKLYAGKSRLLFKGGKAHRVHIVCAGRTWIHGIY